MRRSVAPHILPTVTGTGVADCAIMKPVKESMLERLLERWEARQRELRGDAARPEKLFRSAEHTCY